MLMQSPTDAHVGSGYAVAMQARSKSFECFHWQGRALESFCTTEAFATSRRHQLIVISCYTRPGLSLGALSERRSKLGLLQPGFDNLAHGPRGKEAKKRPKHVSGVESYLPR